MDKIEFSSSYRLQLTKDFPFDRAIAILPYLEKLGIEMIYMSPYFAIEEGSLNPYKILSTDEIHKEFGSNEAFERFCKACKKHDIKHMIDFVPNHMGMTPCNPWIYDVLKYGRQSRYADYFDIEWDFGGGKIMIPFLSDESTIYFSQECLEVDGKKYPLASTNLNTWNPTVQRHYEIIAWQEGRKCVNYRRFFDITELIGICQENPNLYRDLHKSLFDWVKKGWIHGIRIDHPDGIYYPRKYLEQLKKDAGENIYLIVEKILQPEEPLRENWPVHGTVGYEVLNTLNSVFIDPNAEKQIESTYQSFTKEKLNSKELLVSLKRSYMKNYLLSEIRMFSTMLYRIAKSRKQQIRKREIERGLIEFLAHFPIYRSYLEEGKEIHQHDQGAITKSIEKMKVGDKLKLFFANEVLHPAYREVILKIQSRMPAFFAKGFEDTFLYRYLRMTALNEVGGDPACFGISLETFHRRNQLRFQRCPATMVTTSTHDTKRSLDTRMRISILSEVPEQWKERLYLWHNKGPKFPHKVVEYLFYQSLIGIWPESHPACEERLKLGQRLKSYLIKAMREGKDTSDWIHPNHKLEARCERAVDLLVSLEEQAPFWQSFYPFQKIVVGAGRLKSISALLLKMALFGVSDFYQGEELWDCNLVDPDNRREIDFALREKILSDLLEKEDFDQWVTHFESGHIKMYVMQKVLMLRKKERELFIYGDYIPIHTHRDEIAFKRKLDKKEIYVAVPRFTVSTKPLHIPEGFTDIFCNKMSVYWPFVFAKNF